MASPAAGEEASRPKVLFVMADYGHDPTETAIPFMAFHEAGFEIEFATEDGKQPVCDKRMLEGWTQKLLGANATALRAHKRMLELPPIGNPRSWSSPDFSLEQYNLLFFPGGHDKGVRQVIDSPIVHRHIAAYFPQTLRANPANGAIDSDAKATANGSIKSSERFPTAAKAVAAVCHGVMVLSESCYDASPSSLPSPSSPTSPPPPVSPPSSPVNQPPNGNNSNEYTNDLLDKAGKSILWDVETTALPAFFEKVAFHGTRLFLGDYYKTYGAGSESVEQAVCKRLRDKGKGGLWRGYIGFKPYVVESKRYRYVSARWPGDADELAAKVVEMVRNGEKVEGAGKT